MGEQSTTVTMDQEVKKTFDSIQKGIESLKTEQAKNLETVKNEIGGKLDEAQKKMEDIEGRVNLISVSNKKDEILKDPKRGFQNHLEFFNDVIEAGKNGMRPDKMPERLREMYNAVGSDEAKVSNNPDGGFLVPPAFLAGLLTTDPLMEQVDTGALTRKVPMQSDTVYINARVDKDHSSSVSGGFRVYRREEAATVEASKGSFEQIKLQANSMMGLSYASEEIITRSPISFASLIQSGFSDEKTGKLNYERIWGTGVGEYTGIMNSAALITVAKESGQTADTINGTNLVKMRERIWGYNRAVWMCNQDTYVQLTGAHITGTNNDVFLFNPERGTDVPATLLGRPVMFDENMATLGDLGDIVLVNWYEYLEGMLGGATFMESMHVRFVYNERAFRFTVYNDGAPWWKTVMTPKKSAVTRSPFVALAAR